MKQSIRLSALACAVVLACGIAQAADFPTTPPAPGPAPKLRIPTPVRQVLANGMEVVTVATRRSRPDVLNPAIKSLNYLNNILAKIECIRAGVQECIMLNDRGLVAECSADNIFILSSDYSGNIELRTPPVTSGSLEGVTRDAVIGLARELGVNVVERDIALFDIYSANEAFLTGTAAEVVPLTKLDERVIADGKPGDVTRRIIEAYKALTRNEGDDVFAK